MSIDALELIESQARLDRAALAKSGFRETHSARPPFMWTEGPHLAAAYENKISHEFGLATGNKKLSDL